MTNDDRISDSQLSYIDGLARETLVDFESIETLDAYVEPVYGCSVLHLNRGQASMLIDDMRYECYEEGEPPDYPSIYPGRS